MVPAELSGKAEKNDHDREERRAVSCKWPEFNPRGATNFLVC